MMKCMGWKEGEGLGKGRNKGAVEPVPLMVSVVASAGIGCEHAVVDLTAAPVTGNVGEGGFSGGTTGGVGGVELVLQHAKKKGAQAARHRLLRARFEKLG